MWIDFEGIDGSGKTTLSVRVARRLRERGLPVTHPREEGAFRSRLPARIRELTRDAESALLAPAAELLLNAARESQLLAEEIRPALARGQVVVTDRALYSHVGMAHDVRGLPRDAAQAVANFASDGLWPDLVVFVDVDPDVARLRKRMRKIRDKRLGESGRKGLLGQAFMRLSREAFRGMAAADPARWHVLENTWRSVEDAEEEALAILAPALRLPALPRRAAPAPLEVEPGEGLAQWTRNFFQFASVLAARDPGMAALFVAGIDDPRADAIRGLALEDFPDVAAWTVTGMGSPAAWEIRRRAALRAPYHVARSLNGLADPVAWGWRQELRRTAPDQVAYSLSGLDSGEAHDLRERLWEVAPEETLRSVRGLSDARSWGFRLRGLRDGASAALAESLTGLPAALPWQLRERLRDEFPVSVLRSVKRLADARAWALRHEMSSAAPRVVLETIDGLGDEEAEKVRDAFQDQLPDEVAASVGELDTPAAWRRRHACLEAAPAAVVSSLFGFPGDPLAVAFAEKALARAGGRPRLVRKAVIFHLKERRPCGQAAAA